MHREEHQSDVVHKSYSSFLQGIQQSRDEQNMQWKGAWSGVPLLRDRVQIWRREWDARKDWWVQSWIGISEWQVWNLEEGEGSSRYTGSVYP